MIKRDPVTEEFDKKARLSRKLCRQLLQLPEDSEEYNKTLAEMRVVDKEIQVILNFNYE